MEKYLAPMHKKLAQINNSFHTKAVPFCTSFLFQINPFWYQLFYYLILSLLGFLCLKATKQSSPVSSTLLEEHNGNLDLFFTSVSATTISSMSTLEMETFSSAQLLILLILMLSGGEVFISLLALQLRKTKYKRKIDNNNNNNNILLSSSFSPSQTIKYRSLRALAQVVLGYLLVSHIIGYSFVSLYISLTPSATKVLERKTIEMHLFSLFTTVSTFANCGFIPTNENMVVFRGNSGLLLIPIPQILLGNKLYPCCLRLVIWVLEKLTGKDEYKYMLKNNEKLGYGLLMSGYDALLLGVTAVGLVAVQFLVFCILEWNSEVLMGLDWYQKLVGSLFQAVNSRHSGESIVDLSLLSPPTLVLFVLMMYLPPYTTFEPNIGQEREKESSAEKRSCKSGKGSALENLKLSQACYLAIFIMVICITERRHLKDDPLNFNVFNIVLEVVSAYGNVGFSTGYSCKRRLVGSNRENCKDNWSGFVGRWSSEGKLVLIFVMLFGRLKKFSFNGGQSWKLFP